jgi:hypothetical protein
MGKVESACSNCCDVIYFDGASNFQKAGRILEVTYPRTMVVHGAEHVVSLFLTTCSTYLFFNSSIKLQEDCIEYSEMVQCMHLM